MVKYNPQQIEEKWQKKWEESGLYRTPDKIKGKKNFYHLVMFPYPSGDLHIGHWYNFAPADVYARFKRMQGFNIMSPIGFDSFGLPAENAAIKRGIHPSQWTQNNINRMRKQLKSIGTIYDWSREIITSEPEYYKWTQWMFLQLYKKGLAYKAKVPANFCPSCKTVLANEQVVDGRCERCDSEVVQEEIEQWLLKISDYAERLLNDLDKLDWPETTKIMQRNWIGKSEGWNIKFPIPNSQFSIPVFTTRADTLFGCTYVVVAPEHPIIERLKDRINNFKEVGEYIEKSKKKTERERISEVKEKGGVKIEGVQAVNPVSNKEVPIFVADYVLFHYGTGAIMAVPAHDQRDFDFAKSYNLPIIEVIHPVVPPKPLLDKAPLTVSSDLEKEAYEGEGFLINSERFNGMKSEEARERIGQWLQKQKKAEKKTYFRLRDWLISRQRYWGAPIPMVFCKECARLRGQGWQPVKEKDLPVLLPDLKDFRPTGQGESPLAKVKDFVNTDCPKCGKPARRETDTMDTFICSSWYYLRYTDPHNDKKFADKNKVKAWLPVNMYIGGAEHSVLHLLYSRFFTKALKDMKYVDFKEPFLSLRHQGIIWGPDGQKMSKSKGNVVDPDEQVKKYGSDSVRMYLCFMGPYLQGGPWNPNGIVGIHRFLQRIWNLSEKSKFQSPNSKQIPNRKFQKLLQQTIKKVTEDVDNFRFNTAISALMILINEITKEAESIKAKDWKLIIQLLAPFAPHMAEELWAKSGGKDSVHNQKWPQYDHKLIKEEKIQLIIQVNGKVRDKIEVSADVGEEEAKDLAFSQKKVQNWIYGKDIKKVIFISGKLINIVI